MGLALQSPFLLSGIPAHHTSPLGFFPSSVLRRDDEFGIPCCTSVSAHPMHAYILSAPTLFYNMVHSRVCAAANTRSIAVFPLICNLAKCAVRSSTTSNLLLGRCGHRKWVRRETEQVLQGLETPHPLHSLLET